MGVGVELFRTIHGSRMYGFSEDDSDFDTYIVTTSDRKKTQHTIDGDQDLVVVGFERFYELTQTGSHQAVEALFSPFKEWADTPEADMYRPLIEGIRVRGTEVSQKYWRTIKAFCFGNFKRRRHAARLSLGLEELELSGKLSPNLAPGEVQHCNLMANTYRGRELLTELRRGAFYSERFRES